MTGFFAFTKFIWRQTRLRFALQNKKGAATEAAAPKNATSICYHTKSFHHYTRNEKTEVNIFTEIKMLTPSIMVI